MKLTNCLRTLLSAFFVMSLLSLTHAGQTGVVVSPSAGGGKVKTDTSKALSEKVEPGKVKPKAVPEETKVAPKKKKVEIKEPQKATLPVKCNGKVVTILGTSGDDFLNGTPGSDVIHGLGGDDIIRGMGGDDIICGGDGNDTLDGSEGNDILDGGKGNDVCINGPSGKGILVAPKNCEKQGLPYKVGVSPKTQGKSADARTGFVPDKKAQMAQLEKQKQSKAKKTNIAAQQDTTKQRSGDTSLGKSMLKPSGFVKFKTHLSVKLQGKDFTQWGTDWKDTSPSDLKFQWKTIKGTNEFSGKWQISLLENFNTILFEGDAGMVPGQGEEYRWFYIDFKTWNHPIPVTYYVRVVPITESKLYSPSPPVTVSIIKATDSTEFTMEGLGQTTKQLHPEYWNPMPIRVTLGNLKIIKADEENDEEPYIIAAIIYADGTSIDLLHMGNSRIRMHTTNQTHGNVWSDGNLGIGDSPHVMEGPWNTTILPIGLNVLDSWETVLENKIPSIDTFIKSTFVGVLVIAMEEDATATSDADSLKHTALSSLENEINGVIRSIDINLTSDPNQIKDQVIDQLEAIMTKVSSEIENKVDDIVESKIPLFNFYIGQVADRDDNVGGAFGLVSYKQIMDAAPSSVVIPMDFNSCDGCDAHYKINVSIRKM